MKVFLKDYFLSFFVHERAKSIYKRSFIITFINVILLLIIIFLSTFFSQEISFKYYFDHCVDLKEVIADILPDETVIRDGKMTVPFVYNSFINDEKHFLNKGYHVILDTRDAKTTFDDFTLQMVNGSNENISYESYLLLEDNQKEEYTSLITRNGIYLDTVSNIPKYENYLSSQDNDSFVETKEKYLDGKMTEKEYADNIYVLYGKSYYPEDVYTCDSYGGLPTMRSYYLSLINSQGPDQNYIFFYQEGLECCFYSKGKNIPFYGNYSKMNEFDLYNDKANQIDSFVIQSYRNSSSLRIVAYLFIGFFTWFIFVIAFIVCVFVTRLILSLTRKNEKHYTLKIMNLMGSFVLFSSLIIGLIGLFMGFVFSNTTIIIVVPISILIIVILRTAIYYLREKQPSDYIAEK